MVTSDLMDGELQYRVLFTGSLTGEFELEECKRRFGDLFGVPQERIERYFSGRAVVLRKNLPEPAAMDLAIQVTEIGCECSVELMPDPNDLSLQPGFVERRKQVRRKRFRRPPRAGAIVPDRRSVASRRKMDLIELEKYGDFPGMTVGPDD